MKRIQRNESNMDSQEVGKIIEIKNELFELRMKQATGSLEKPHMINALRKDVARLKTVLTENDYIQFYKAITFGKHPACKRDSTQVRLCQFILFVW